MNYLDIGALVVVALCAFNGYNRGLIRTLYGFVSFFVAMVLARVFYPYVAEFLRNSAVFATIQNGIKSGLNLESHVTEHANLRQAEIIDGLPIPMPQQLRTILHERVDVDVNGILRVDLIENYISEFFANIAINGIAMFAVFIIVIALLSTVGHFVNIVGKLPVIRTFNQGGGLLLGVLMGAGISWVCIIVLSLFFATSNPQLFELLQESFFARIVLDSMFSSVV
jgi:uncharacterized membrane protein required for colicin V production